MGKRKRKLLILFLVFSLVVIMVLVTAWYFFIGPDYSSKYRGNGKILENPVKGLSLEEAINQFDEDDVYYLSVAIRAYNLHNALFSDDTPKIELHADNDIYSIEIIDGRVLIDRGEKVSKDIVIYTTKEETVKMLMDLDYIQESFKKGSSSVELVAGEFELASKGYLKLYESFRE